MDRPLLNVLVEGPDCAGKSTLVKELHNRLGLDAYFCGHRDGDQFRRYGRLYLNADGAVFERGHLSEYVYAQLFGREMLAAADMRLLTEIVDRNFVVVGCLPDLELALSRYRARSQEISQQVDEDLLRRAHALFAEALEPASWKTLLLYHSQDFAELDAIVNEVAALLGRADA